MPGRQNLNRLTGWSLIRHMMQLEAHRTSKHLPAHELEYQRSILLLCQVSFRLVQPITSSCL